MSKEHLYLLENPENTVFFSAISIIEISIKKSLGKLKIPIEYKNEIEKLNFIPLPVNHQHGYELKYLPFIHTDPFDRIIIVQAIIEELCVISYDQIF